MLRPHRRCTKAIVRQRMVDKSHPGIKKRLAKAINRFFIHSQFAANKKLDHHFLTMIHVSGEAGKYCYKYKLQSRIFDILILVNCRTECPGA